MTTAEPQAVRAKRAHLFVAWGLTAASAIVYLTSVALTWGELPARLATHFGVDGRPDEFMPTGAALAFQGAIVIGVPVLMLLVFSSLDWWRGAQARPYTGLLAGLSSGLTTLFVTQLMAHVGTADPTQVRLGATGAWALGVGLLVGTATALLLPKAPPRAQPAPVVPLRLADGDRASWFGRATMRQREQLVIVGAVVAMVLAAVLSGIWWLWLLVGLLALLALGLTSFRVVVDASGVSWRGNLGLPRGHIDLDVIERAAVVDVELSDFGGLGLRTLPGKLGVITRLGPALLVSHDGRQFVITVDDAHTAAALVEGLRAGRASRPPPAAGHR